MSAAAFRWFPGAELRPVAVVSSRRVPYRPPAPVVTAPIPVKRLASAVRTPIFDRLAWEHGRDPLDPLGGRPAPRDVLDGIVLAAGVR